MGTRSQRPVKAICRAFWSAAQADRAGNQLSRREEPQGSVGQQVSSPIMESVKQTPRWPPRRQSPR
jgi:hypothetical protein